MTDEEAPARANQFAQTLDRGLKIMESLSEAPEGMTITELAVDLDVHRSIVARLLSTLAVRGYVFRMNDGAYRLGLKVFSLARLSSHNTLVAATPLMMEAAKTLNATIVLHVADKNEAVTMASVEPPSGTFRLGMRPGTRHPLSVAAHGMAILAGREPVRGEREEVPLARERGYAVSVGEIIPNFAGIAAPIYSAGETDTSVSCVVPREKLPDLKEVAAEVVRLAEKLSLILG